MRLERTRLLATILVVLGLWSALAYVRGRRRRARAALEDFLAHGQLAARDSDDDRGDPFIELRSLEEARSMDHTAVIMQGGGGAQIYLTVPVKHVACEQPTLVALLKLLDAMEWNDPPRATISFELAPIGSGIYAGMGGASIIDGIWLHPRFNGIDVMDAVSAVILGLRPIEGMKSDFSTRLPKR
jgi:hypothetical protein